MALRDKFISKCVIVNLYLHCFLTGGQVEYKYPTGELFIVDLAMAGMCSKCIRVSNLPPEVSNYTLRALLAPFGKILDIQADMWSKAYRYSVSNSIRFIGTR